MIIGFINLLSYVNLVSSVKGLAMAIEAPAKTKAMMTLIPVDIRRQALGTLRMEGVTMQAFLTEVLRLVAARDPRVTSIVDELHAESS